MDGHLGCASSIPFPHWQSSPESTGPGLTGIKGPQAAFRIVARMKSAIPASQACNAVLAAKLREFADLLAFQNAENVPILAYRRAADVIENLKRPVDEILATDGREGLISLRAIGTSIAAALVELIATGRWSQLDRLRGIVEPEKLFQTIPGVGARLSRRICDSLQIETLEALEAAAHHGRLARIPGIGPRRSEMIRVALEARLGRLRLDRVQQAVHPPIALVLDVDREYRERAAAGNLRRITPRRCNPKAEAWLPVLHTRRDQWEFTALFSNTALAHELGRVKDWVIIYYRTDRLPEGQCTVVTETRGPLRGQRVVRGREEECQAILAVA